MRTVDEIGVREQKRTNMRKLSTQPLQTGRYLGAHLAGKSQRKFLAIIYLG